jgi:hypothetical protein
MPKLIWKTDDEFQFNLFKFYDGVMPCDNNGSHYSFVFKMIELMNQEARIIFANYTFTDNFWEVLDDDNVNNTVVEDSDNEDAEVEAEVQAAPIAQAPEVAAIPQAAGEEKKKKTVIRKKGT